MPLTQVPRTLDNTREVDETIVEPDDEEVLQVRDYTRRLKGAMRRLLLPAFWDRGWPVESGVWGPHPPPEFIFAVGVAFSAVFRTRWRTSSRSISAGRRRPRSW